MAKKSSVNRFHGGQIPAQEVKQNTDRSRAIWREAIRRELHAFVDQLIEGPKTAREIDGWARSTVEGIGNVIVAAMPAFDHIIGLEVDRIESNELDLLHTLSAPTNRSEFLHQKHAPWTARGFGKANPIARGMRERRLHRLRKPAQRRIIVGRLLRELANDSGLPGFHDLADDLVAVSAGQATALLTPTKGKKRKSVAYQLHRIRLAALVQREFLLELGCLEGDRSRFNEAFAELFAVSESLLATWRQAVGGVFGVKAVAAKIRQGADAAVRCKDCVSKANGTGPAQAQLNATSRSYNEVALDNLAIEHRLLMGKQKYEIRIDRHGEQKMLRVRAAVEDVHRRFPEISSAYRRCGLGSSRYSLMDATEA